MTEITLRRSAKEVVAQRFWASRARSIFSLMLSGVSTGT